MTSKLQNNFAFAHQANIDRYRWLLTTYLTANEREFVERRLAEEQAALKELAKSSASVTTASTR